MSSIPAIVLVLQNNYCATVKVIYMTAALSKFLLTKLSEQEITKPLLLTLCRLFFQPVRGLW